MNAGEAKRLRNEAEVRQREGHAHLVEIVTKGVDKRIEQFARLNRSSIAISNRGVVAEICNHHPPVVIDGRHVNTELILKMVGEHYQKLGFKTGIEEETLLIHW